MCQRNVVPVEWYEPEIVLVLKTKMLSKHYVEKGQVSLFFFFAAGNKTLLRINL